MPGITTELLLILLLLLVNGLLARSEMAIVSARETRRQQRADSGDAGAAAALDLAREPTHFLSTVQIGITLVGILAGAFGGATVAAAIRQALEPIPLLAPYAQAIGMVVVVAAITFLSLVVGELVPKRLALNAPEHIAVLVAPRCACSPAGGPTCATPSRPTSARSRAAKRPTTRTGPAAMARRDAAMGRTA